MTEHYSLTFPVTAIWRKNTQKILLILAIAMDVGNIFVLIDSILGSAYYWILFVGLMVLATAMRVVSMMLNYSYVYSFCNDRLTIDKVYSIKTIKVLELNNESDYSIEPLESVPHDTIMLYGEMCGLDKYSLCASGKKYCIALDGYMLAMITTRIKGD